MVGIAENERQFRIGAGGHGFGGIEAAPVAGDLLEELATVFIVAGAVFGDGFFQDVAGFGELAAIEIHFGEFVAGVRVLVEEGTVERDVMIVGREFEAADAVGGAGEAFVIGEGFQGEDAFVGIGILQLGTRESEGFDTELGSRELGEGQSGFPCLIRRQAGLFGEGETPALAIVFGGFPRGGDLIENGAVLVPWRAFVETLRTRVVPFGQAFEWC